MTLNKTSIKTFATPLAITYSILLLMASSATVYAAEKIEVHDAWVREAPPAATVMAAYLTLHNHSAKAYTLVRLSSPDFKKVEMHRMEQHDGMNKMIPVSRVILSSKGSVSFQPGGMHLMLMKPKRPFKAGDTINLTLFFTDKSSMKVSLPVKKATAEAGHDMHSGHHDHDAHSHQH